VDLEDLVRSLAGDDRLVHLERLPARRARFGHLARPLPGEVEARLGVRRLWSHQAEAIDLARSGRSVAVATGTASGKSLCYQALIGEAAGGPGDHAGTSLLLFPTKALARDQLRSLGELDLPGVVAACYDGDTGPEERAFARANATALLTNPDMLHVGLLPHHGRWATFLMRLRYVVVDELHTLRGVFGSHVAQLLRRLRRLCDHYGSSPTFLFTSATIGHPAVLASSLAGVPVTAVTEDGSPRGERLFALWNPPLLDARSGARASANGETAALVAGLVDGGHRAIAFCRSRKGTELVAADATRRLGRPGAVRPYRGGYLPSERREIEGELFGGQLQGVVATSALELGIDVGGLDACVLDGFPGTIASMWQQAGRAGRARQRSLAVLVAGDDQLDQWLMTHPAEVFRRSPEPAVINPSNHHVLLPHLACAPTSSRSPWPTSSGGGTTWTTACGPSSSPTG
jgi:DEAD/DEAH box helicase domain-containing protein